MSSAVYFFISSHFAAFSCSLWISRWPSIFTGAFKAIKTKSPESAHTLQPTACLHLQSEVSSLLTHAVPPNSLPSPLLALIILPSWFAQTWSIKPRINCCRAALQQGKASEIASNLTFSPLGPSILTHVLLSTHNHTPALPSTYTQDVRLLQHHDIVSPLWLPTPTSCVKQSEPHKAPTYLQISSEALWPLHERPR